MAESDDHPFLVNGLLMTFKNSSRFCSNKYKHGKNYPSKRETNEKRYIQED